MKGESYFMKNMIKSSVAFGISILVSIIGYSAASFSSAIFFSTQQNRTLIFFLALTVNIIVISVIACILFKNECEQEHLDKKNSLIQKENALQIYKHYKTLKNTNISFEQVALLLEEETEILEMLIERHKKANDSLSELLGI